MRECLVLVFEDHDLLQKTILVDSSAPLLRNLDRSDKFNSDLQLSLRKDVHILGTFNLVDQCCLTNSESSNLSVLTNSGNLFVLELVGLSDL